MSANIRKSLHLAAALGALLTLSPILAAGGGGGGGGGTPSSSAEKYDPAMDYQKGTAAYKAGDYATAVKHFKKVAGALPKDAAAQYLLGASYLGLNDPKKAEKPLGLALKYNAKMIEAHRDYGIVQAKLGKADKAASQLAALKSMQTACGDICTDKAKLADAVTKVEAAMATGKQAAITAPAVQLAEAGSADETYVTAVSLINEKQYEKAIAYLNDARWAAGPHPDILTYLGFANRKLERFDVAEAYYRSALDIFPEHRGALEYYGELKLERGDVAGAKNHLAKLEAICGFGCNEADELRRQIAEKASSAS